MADNDRMLNNINTLDDNFTNKYNKDNADVKKIETSNTEIDKNQNYVNSQNENYYMRNIPGEGDTDSDSSFIGGMLSKRRKSRKGRKTRKSRKSRKSLKGRKSGKSRNTKKSIKKNRKRYIGGTKYGSGYGANCYDPNFSIYNTRELTLFPYKPT